MSTDLTPHVTGPNRALPHLRSELARLTNRRLYRVLVVLLLVGLTFVSVVAFATSSKTNRIPPDAQQQYERAAASFDRTFPNMVRDYERCVTQVPEAATPDDYCGPAPDRVQDAPRPEWFYPDKRYDATKNLPAVVIAVSVAAALLAFVLGASSGGAEWSSRSMTLQLLWEPRRLRLLGIKWLALVIVTVTTMIVTLVVALALAWLTSVLRGTPDAIDGAFDPGFFTTLGGTAVRGGAFAAIAGSFGYAIAMLVRNTGAALGTAFIYFAVVENAVRVALPRFGPEPFLLGSNSVAFLVPGGLEVPGASTTVSEPGGGLSTSVDMVQLTNLRSLTTLLVYLAVVSVAAVWSFTRRDVA